MPLLRHYICIFVVLVCTITSTHAALNHLEPIPAHSSDGYDRAVLNALRGNKPAVLWMICRPSFSAEFAVLLRSMTVSGKVNFEPVAKRRWLLEVATATQQIWHFKKYPPAYHGPIELDLRKSVQVERKLTVIEPVLAQALQDVWLVVVSQTRQPVGNDQGLDGVTYQFFIGPSHFGQTWSPRTGVPAKFVNLALQLGTAVESPPAEQKALLHQCFRTARKLRAEANLIQPDPRDNKLRGFSKSSTSAPNPHSAPLPR